ASLDLEVGADALIENCVYMTNLNDVVCAFTNGPVTRAFGNIFPGEKVREVYRLLPLKAGPITSCLGISDQNIQLQVAVGNIGCLVGQYPPTLGVPEGLPVVNVAPIPNQLGVSPTAPVSAFFSELMDEASITTGDGGSFNVLDPAGNLVTGGIRFVTIGARTVAIWQRDGGFNILDDNTKYEVILTSAIRDLEGNALFNPWQSSFRTTSLLNDQDPPELTMTILPPVDPNFVLPGQLVQVNAYASDQGTGIRRVELYIKSLDATNALYQLIDQKTVFDPLSTLEPSVFTIDSSSLTPGQTYQLLGTAYDVAGNARDSTLSFIVAASADPPVITLPADPTNFVLRGVSVPLTPTSVSGGVRQVQFHLDGATNAFATVFLAPWQTTLRTLDLAVGIHTVKAVAVDALLQTGQDEFVFELVENLNEPQVNFGATVSGAQYVTGTPVSVLGFVDDPTGVKSVRFFLNDVNGSPLSTNLSPFQLDTTGLSTGTYRVILLASNNLGIANNPLDPSSFVEFTLVQSPPGPPPPAPNVTNLSDPDDGTTTVVGSSVPGASIIILNDSIGAVQNVTVASNGVFTGVISAVGGDSLSLTAFHAPTSPSNSAPTLVTVPVPPVVTNLLVTPDSRTFTAAGQFQDFVVTAQLAGGGSSNVTARSTFSSSSAAIASVNQAGRMVAQNNGIATLTATFKTNTAQASITVNIVVLTNFTVAVSKSTLVFPGDTASLSVTGQYSNGTSAPLSSGISYGAANPQVVTVSGNGTISATGEGTATISVAVGALPPKNIPVTVNFSLNPPPTTAILSPANGTQIERGQFVTVNAQATDPTGGVMRTEFRMTGAFSSTSSVSYSVRAIDTRSFSFAVPTNATIGDTITASAWSVDVGNLVSATSTITMTVADLTAPTVAITGPTNGAAYNGLQTVTVAVAVSDAVGVSQVRYETEDAFSLSGVSNLVPPVGSTTVSFSFVLPPNAPSSSLVVRAFASDLIGNTRTSAPLSLLMTDADITPPETIITSAVAGSSNSIVTLSYRVTEGLDDLSEVGVYYRRNGIGTFNRWTEVDGTNVLGRYLPAAGSNGVVVFDATKMGGDGVYEFYTVGVDARGNRELPPVLPDQTFSVAPFFTWTTVTSGTFISAIDGNYEDQNLRLSNAYVVIEGAHTFGNIELLGTSRITHAATTTTNEPQFNLTAWTISVASNASIDVTGRGYLGGWQGDNASVLGRTTNNAFGSTVRSAGSYGGIGGIVSGVPNNLYGSVTAPIELGSGGSSNGGSTWKGGNGGGRIAINAINIAADGPIRANGDPNLGDNSGSGSGGSVYLITRTLSGTGWVVANGGGNQVGGGGGRVAVHHIDLATKDPTQIRALGGDGTTVDGGNGTVFLLGFGSSNGTLVVDGQGVSSPFSSLPIPVGFTFDNIIIRNNARAIVDDPIIVNDSLRIETGSILTHSVAQTNGLRINAARVIVDGTSAIDVTGKAYRGGRRDGNVSNSGETLGGQAGATIVRSGGSYGGLGANGGGEGSNLVYGAPDQPDYLGA
ncbi:MAG: Ig-like domain-containing protein, partial [Kiritimatiellae bacterium]|nr:Ig-like domain-containing protein [Kiritimatiellia bacterium]